MVVKSLGVENSLGTSDYIIFHASYLSFLSRTVNTGAEKVNSRTSLDLQSSYMRTVLSAYFGTAPPPTIAIKFVRCSISPWATLPATFSSEISVTLIFFYEM